MEEGKNQTMSLLEVEDVSKAYGGIHALQGCSISVERGSITGLIGPNSSGKTTMFHVITGYERPDAGDVLYDRRSITGATPEQVRCLGIGRTFQLTRTFPRLTVLENMHVALRHKGVRGLFGRWSSAQESHRALDLLDFVGIRELKDMPAGNVSCGQKKLLEFAFILTAQPQIILLDEPAGGVNPTMINHMAEHIRALNRRGATFLIVEHNMEFLMGLCDTVIMLHWGTKVAAGTPLQIRSDPVVLDAYLGES
jgi:ABC-type branched-subunit amino acid transport system ATPase component